MTAQGRPWPLVIAGSALALSVAMILGGHGPVRGVLALWFFLTCPGMAIAGLLDVRDLLAEVLIAVALSVALGMLLTLIMVLTHSWSTGVATGILVALTLVGAGAQAWRAQVRR